MSNKEFNFKLQSIDIIDVFLLHPETPLPKECQYNFDINIQQNIHGHENLIVVSPVISIRINDSEKIYGRFKSNMFFQILNLDDYLNQESGGYTIPDIFITTLNSISISTSRGLMFSEFKGTFLHSAILPILNPGDFKKETEQVDQEL